MSILSKFVTEHLITSLESEFIQHEPQIQAALLAEVNLFLTKISEWAESKLSKQKE